MWKIILTNRKVIFTNRSGCGRHSTTKSKTTPKTERDEDNIGEYHGQIYIVRITVLAEDFQRIHQPGNTLDKDKDKDQAKTKTKT